MHSRRTFLRGAAFGAPLFTTLFTTRGLFAETLTATPSLTEGPFYPDKMPLDTDNDLLIINDAITPAIGEITHLTGRLLTTAGEPMRNVFVEIWQVDAKASYLHTNGRGPAGPDQNFQGYGRFLTDSRGQYYFRTVKPVPYTLNGAFRTPHIHFALSRNGRRILTTQTHIRGHQDNARDSVLQGVRDPALRETVMSDFVPLPGSKIGELTANFDIVLGSTAVEVDDGGIRGGLGAPERGGRGGMGGGGFGRGGRGPRF
ncbi:MAG TPA: protocatechuate 3,4-dioxygenase [Terriglobia bacterium]|nr:protocatechuate 3,4-dioxygenase [Terriglobia bacterium]